MAQPLIQPIAGFTIVPASISNLGVVTFTDDGTNNIAPNQRQCEAYGYRYDETSDIVKK